MSIIFPNIVKIWYKKISSLFDSHRRRARGLKESYSRLLGSISCIGSTHGLRQVRRFLSSYRLFSVLFIFRNSIFHLTLLPSNGWFRRQPHYSEILRGEVCAHADRTSQLPWVGFGWTVQLVLTGIIWRPLIFLGLSNLLYSLPPFLRANNKCANTILGMILLIN